MLDGYFRKLTLVVMWKRSESKGWVVNEETLPTDQEGGGGEVCG